jgi:hypothetical protein
MDEDLIDLLRDRFEDGSFTPLEALEALTFKQLPVHIQGYLRVHGPGVGATKMMSRHLVAAGAHRLSTRTGRGYLLAIPLPTCDHCLKLHLGECALKSTPAAPQPNTYLEEVNHDAEA